MERIASEKLGSRVDIQSFNVHLSNLSLDLNGITVDGKDPVPTAHFSKWTTSA